MKVTIEVPAALAARLRRAEDAIRGAARSDGSILPASAVAAHLVADLVLDALPVSPKLGQRVRSTNSYYYELLGEVLFVHEPSETCLVLWDGDSAPGLARFDRLEVIG